MGPRLRADDTQRECRRNNSRMRCGDTGSRVTAPGTPMASSIALAITPPTPLMPPSPAPFSPSGWRGACFVANPKFVEAFGHAPTMTKPASNADLRGAFLTYQF